MAKKYYAVRKGRKTGVFATWAECQKQVTGFSGAEFKSFGTMEEARIFVGSNTSADCGVAAGNRIPSQNSSEGVIAYVDGSYRSDTGEFSYGMVILQDGEEHTFCQKMTDKELALMHNVAAKWCTGAWKANKSGTQAYQAFYQAAVKKVKIHFVKVKGHSNDKYNDMADQLAKSALGI